jgi:hypothetical protein
VGARWIAIVAGASVCFAAPVAHAGPNPLRFGPTEWPKGYAYGGSVATGDVTGDGRVDIVAGQGEPIPNDYNVVLFAQDADGSFAAPLRYDLDARYAATVQVGVGDLDSDGFADVAAASPNGIHVFYGSTDGLEGPLRIANTDWAMGVELADMDGEGDLDLVSNRNGPGLLLVRNDRVAFSAATIGAESNYEIELGDVTGDGRVDVVGQQSRTTRVYRQLADGTFAPPTEHTTLDSAESIAIADLNGDGLNDVARTHDGRVDVLYQHAAGGLDEPARISSYPYAATLEAGDLDGDGRDDLVTSHRTRGLLGVYLQKPDGTLGSEDPYEFRYSLYGPQVIAVADLDRDDLLDLVTAGPYLLRQLPRIRPPAPGEYRIVESADAVMIPGDTDVGAHCDNCVVRIDFPFAVPLYERWYAQAWIDPHGALFFDHPTTTIHRHCVPWYDREDALFPAWSKYHVGGVYTAVTGSAPQRRFVIEWRLFASMGPGDGLANFEVIFHEDSAVISVVFGEMVADPGNVVAGIQRDRGSATSYACHDSNFIEGTRVDYVPTFAPSRQDLSPPETSLESGPSGSTAVRTASFAFKASEAGAGFECSVDSESYAGCASPKRVQELAPGHHTFEVRAIDAGGNRDPTPAQRTWNVTTVPEPVVLAAGDIAGCAWSGDESTAAILDGYPDATVAALGDTVYHNGTTTEYTNCYEPSWGRHKARTKPAVGNHEYGTANAAGYFGYFGASAGPAGKGWYSYDLGAWHVVVLNGNCLIVDCSDSSEQLAWLRADLAASAADCTMAYWHQPLFTSGSHANDPDLPLVRPFWQALYEHGAELILAGHDHDYERFAPQTPAGVADSVYGIRQIVVGTGGAALRGFGTPRANSEVRQSTTHGVLKLVLRSTGYDWQFLPVSGKTFTDAGSGSCHGAPGRSRFVADFNADGKDDVAVWRPSNGTWYLLGEWSGTQWGQAGDVPVPGNYDANTGDADAGDEIAVFRPASGTWYVLGSSPGAQWGQAGDIPVPGDYDGDGDDEFTVFRPATGTWYREGQWSGTQWGLAGDIPVPGDYDADPADEMAVFRPESGTWYVLGSWSGTQWGRAGDIPVPGDFDTDDAADEFTVWRPGSGSWYVEGDWSGTQWGRAGDVPLAGDFDTDPDVDMTIWRPANGVWYTEGDWAGIQWGREGDIP